MLFYYVFIYCSNVISPVNKIDSKQHIIQVQSTGLLYEIAEQNNKNNILFKIQVINMIFDIIKGFMGLIVIILAHYIIKYILFIIFYYPLFTFYINIVLRNKIVLNSIAEDIKKINSDQKEQIFLQFKNNNPDKNITKEKLFSDLDQINHFSQVISFSNQLLLDHLLNTKNTISKNISDQIADIISRSFIILLCFHLLPNNLSIKHPIFKNQFLLSIFNVIEFVIIDYFFLEYKHFFIFLLLIHLFFFIVFIPLFLLIEMSAVGQWIIKIENNFLQKYSNKTFLFICFIMPSIIYITIICIINMLSSSLSDEYYMFANKIYQINKQKNEQKLSNTCSFFSIFVLIYSII